VRKIITKQKEGKDFHFTQNSLDRIFAKRSFFAFFYNEIFFACFAHPLSKPKVALRFLPLERRIKKG
jgi:hypothetical protein